MGKFVYLDSLFLLRMKEGDTMVEILLERLDLFVGMFILTAAQELAKRMFGKKDKRENHPYAAKRNQGGNSKSK